MESAAMTSAEWEIDRARDQAGTGSGGRGFGRARERPAEASAPTGLQAASHASTAPDHSVDVGAPRSPRWRSRGSARRDDLWRL